MARNYRVSRPPAIPPDGRPPRLLERLSDALMRMLAERFGGGTDEGHTEELRGARRHMEEPGMLAETVTRGAKRRSTKASGRAWQKASGRCCGA